MLSFPMFLLATVHLLLAGTDRTTLPLRLGVLATVSILCAITAIRIINLGSHGRANPEHKRAATVDRAR